MYPRHRAARGGLPLLQLNRLTQLELKGAAATDDTVASVFRQLTRLQHLVVTFAEGVTDVSLLALTTLRQLTRLQLLDCGLSTGEGYHGQRAGSLSAVSSVCANVSYKQQQSVAAAVLTLHLDISHCLHHQCAFLCIRVFTTAVIEYTAAVIEYTAI
jgi:hypothetical protein